MCEGVKVCVRCSSIKGASLVKRTSVKGHLEKEERRMESRAEPASPRHRKDRNRAPALAITFQTKVTLTHPSCTYGENGKRGGRNGRKEKLSVFIVLTSLEGIGCVEDLGILSIYFK